MSDYVLHYYSIISKCDFSIIEMYALGKFMKIPTKNLYYLICR